MTSPPIADAANSRSRFGRSAPCDVGPLDVRERDAPGPARRVAPVRGTGRAVRRRRGGRARATKAAAPATGEPPHCERSGSSLRPSASGRSGRPSAGSRRRPASASAAVVGPWGRSRSSTVDTDFAERRSRGAGASDDPRAGASVAVRRRPRRRRAEPRRRRSAVAAGITTSLSGTSASSADHEQHRRAAPRELRDASGRRRPRRRT